jgi:hypothetical protein
MRIDVLGRGQDLFNGIDFYAGARIMSEYMPIAPEPTKTKLGRSL